jgi:16S rRNA (cytidine1402-2'-O)-methyltransferase
MPLGGVLYVVATPIGNLEDITLRALKTLKTVQLVAAEDTRRTGNLLRHFDIEVPIISVHEHNEEARVQKILGRLAKGESVALVTDAGTPGVSDPGAGLVAAVRGAGFRIEPIPGASAVAAAISAAGIKSDGFTFMEFPPVRSKDRKLWFASLLEAAKDRAVVFFEAPHKLHRTLEELIILVDRPIFAARELTKMHEELIWATPSELLARFDNPHGEFTLIIPPGQAAEAAREVLTDIEIQQLVGQITDIDRPKSKREAARIAGERLGLTAKQVYEALERAKVGQ